MSTTQTGLGVRDLRRGVRRRPGQLLASEVDVHLGVEHAFQGRFHHQLDEATETVVSNVSYQGHNARWL
jgi:hypothetical protein